MKNFYCALGNGLFMKLHMVTFSDPTLERFCPYCVTNFTAFTTARAQERKYFNFPLVASGYFCSYSLVPTLTAQLNICILKLNFLP